MHVYIYIYAKQTQSPITARDIYQQLTQRRAKTRLEAASHQSFIFASTSGLGLPWPSADRCWQHKAFADIRAAHHKPVPNLTLPTATLQRHAKQESAYLFFILKMLAVFHSIKIPATINMNQHQQQSKQS